MRHIFGAFWTCLAVVGASACSDATPPAAEGNVTVTLGGRQRAIFGPGGAPTDTSYGGTVLNGTNGVHLSCKVSHSGTYSVQAHIENADMTVDIASGDINTGAQMTFYMPGVTADSETSVNTNSDPWPTCTVTTSQDNSLLTVRSGSIFAKFMCSTVRSRSNLATLDTASGFFLFTGCDK
jgi:hypothetical protein